MIGKLARVAAAAAALWAAPGPGAAETEAPSAAAAACTPTHQASPGAVDECRMARRLQHITTRILDRKLAESGANNLFFTWLALDAEFSDPDLVPPEGFTPGSADSCRQRRKSILATVAVSSTRWLEFCDEAAAGHPVIGQIKVHVDLGYVSAGLPRFSVVGVKPCDTTTYVPAVVRSHTTCRP